jgi:hypothetical protein
MHPASRDQALDAVRAFHAEHGPPVALARVGARDGLEAVRQTIERRWGWRELPAEAIGVRPAEVEVSWVPVLDDRARRC